MLLTLAASSLRAWLLPPGKGKKPKMDILDLPAFARQTLNLHGLALTTDLLAGADRSRIESLRERADKAGSAVLLLSEVNPQPFGGNETDAAAAADRARRVIEAGQLLGASAISMTVTAADDPKVFDVVVDRLKKVMERAERLDMSVLLAPGPGLTSTPDRITDLIKRVGGFRIGTYPDFQTASKAADPLAYLRRLTPYATAVCASTLKFLDTYEEYEPPAPAGRVPGNKLNELLEKVLKAQPGAKAGGKPGAKAGTPAPEEAKPEEPEEDEGEEDEEEEDLDALEADLAMGDEDDDEPAPIRAPKHEGYDLRAMVAAIASVGYDGPLAVDYRGDGDVTLGLQRSRDALQAALAQAPDAG